MSPAGDEDLRRLFGERRTSGEAEAPPFRMFLERGRSGAARPRIGLPRLLVAASAILAFAALLGLLLRRPQPDVRIGEWKAPTDFLLEAPYPGLLETTPVLLEKVPDYAPLLASGKGSTS
jgi:hypothetical protein